MSNVRRALLATTSVVGLIGVGAVPSLAQDAERVEKVTVTGTRIKQPNTESNSEIQTITQQKIEMSGEANIANVLRDLPIIGVPLLSSANSNFLTTGNGINTIDIRNMGTNRTLVLINGRRVVAGVPLTQIVDLNQIPTEMIERVDVLAGGSSAVYGSDAVAGVVNIILKRNFEGVSVNVQGGATETYEEHDTYRATGTIGANFHDDRGNAVLSVGYLNEGPAYARSRDPVDCLSGLFFGGSTFQQVCPFFSGFSEGGRFRLSNAAAQPSVQRVIDHVDGTTVRAPVAADGFNRQAQRLHFVPFDRYQFTGAVNYEFAPSHTVFSEMSWSGTNSVSEIEPRPLETQDVYGGSEQVGAATGQRFGIAPDNPYIPRALLDELGTRFGIVNPELLARPALVAQLMAIPGAAVGFQRRMTEIGNRGQDFQSNTARFVFGAEGPLGNWDYETGFIFGRTQQSQVGEGAGVIAPNLRNALDVVDQNFDLDDNPFTNPQDVICRDPNARVEGCVPINLFVPVRTPATWTAAQINYIRAPEHRRLSQEQEIAYAQFTGPLFEIWAGDVESAVGFEYRREAGSDRTDALTRTGQNTINIAPPTNGSFDVWEGYAELQIPILKDSPLAEELNIHAAGRWSEYSTFGYTQAWSADFEYMPFDGLRVRGQIGRSVRAPNIAELFTGASENFAVVDDPCNNLRVVAPGPIAGGPNDPLSPNFNAIVTANCLSIPAIAARANTAVGFVLTQPELQGTGGFNQGNPNLQPEQGDSWQVGFVATPDLWRSWLGDLTVSMDYFRLEVTDAIAAVTRNQTLDLCFQTPGLASPFCNQTLGGPIGWVRDLNGALIQVNIAAANINQFETEGFDLQFFYNIELGGVFGNGEEDDMGRLSLSAIWQHTDMLDQTALAGTPQATLIPLKGAVGVFEDEWTLGAFYSIGDLSVTYSGRWMSEADGVDIALEILPERVPDQWFHDLSARYNITPYLSVYGGVRNIADNYVFIGPGAFAATPTGWSTEPDTYDGLGRRYFLGIRVNM
jgi:outer membrane cobalamin receptor